MTNKKIIVKDEIDWVSLHPLAYILTFLLNVVYAIILLASSVVPMLNWYVFNKFVKDEDGQQTFKNPLIKQVRYRIVRQTKVTNEVLEKVED